MSGLCARNDDLIREFINNENYQILEDGRILTKINKQGHITNFWREKAISDRSGYKHIKYKGKSLRVHRIVYLKFIGELEASKVINHKDGNPSNNHHSNLELVTQSENNVHRYRVLNSPAVVGYHKINQEIADEIRRQVAEENRRACELSKEYNLAKSTISMILNNKVWKSA